ncbi:TetR/AcrR family transcriptional regulator [Candidatus Amarobacter glycogenicus]|uniref:TetR/AcrR family transcriptional regulator n=1 Tax=Candidatus Amarobacter glycogenicus TaxID=3140699 RepID=UPI003136908F|nr:TetR/AcrR family transcriptional regulator [Dehalococcoidia bacterium]
MARRKRLEDDELLAVARERFVAEGFAASTRGIAQVAGVAEAVLFQRFKTKAELFFAAMLPPPPNLHEILVSRPDWEEPSRRMEDIAIGVLAYFREIAPVLLPLVSHPDFNYESFVARYPESPLNQLVEGLQAWLKRLEARGDVVEGASPAVALALVGTMASLAIFERIGVHGGETPEEMVRQVAAVIWRGAAPAPG